MELSQARKSLGPTGSPERMSASKSSLPMAPRRAAAADPDGALPDDRRQALRGLAEDLDMTDAHFNGVLAQVLAQIQGLVLAQILDRIPDQILDLEMDRLVLHENYSYISLLLIVHIISHFL